MQEPAYTKKELALLLLSDLHAQCPDLIDDKLYEETKARIRDDKNDTVEKTA